MRGHSILPDAPKRRRPKTRAAALAALEDLRRYAARLEETTRQQEDRERELRAELEKLGAGAARGQNALTNTKERLARAEQQRNEKIKENYKRKRQAERLIERLKRSEREVTRKEKALDHARADLAALRRAHEQQAADQEQKEKQRDDESQAHINLLQRRLEAEQAKRSAAEKKLEEALQSGRSPILTNAPIVQSPLVLMPLKLGRYHELAAASGHDLAKDCLFRLMHDEVTVAAEYADWQTIHGERIAARRRDPNQTLDEQAFAATLSTRWRLIDHPHLRLGSIPTWSLPGFLLDEKSEKYLLTIIDQRIKEMRSWLGRSV